MSRRAGRRGLALTGALCVAVAWLAQADARPTAGAGHDLTVPIVVRSGWEIEIYSLATRVETGQLRGFDLANIEARSRGAALGVLGGVKEDSYLLRDPPPGRVDDGPSAYSFATSSTTEVVITCKPSDAYFRADGTGQGSLRVRFQDGNYSPYLHLGENLLLSSAGTGFSKGAIGLKAEGDLAYDPNGAPTGLAESVGDDPSNIEGSVSTPGLEGGPALSYTPHRGAGTHTKALAISNTKSITKKTFQFTLHNHVSSDLMADDSLVGQATAGVEASLRHNVTVRATGCRVDEDTVTELDLQIRLTLPQRLGLVHPALQWETSALVTTTERDDYGNVGTRLTSAHRPYPSLFERTNKKLFVNTGWNPPSQPWRFVEPSKLSGASGRPATREARPATRGSRRLGVRKGSVAVYEVAARRLPLRKLKTLTFKVAKVNAKTGRVVLDGTARFRGGRVDKTRMPVGVFTGLGGIRGILIPVGLKAGERLYGVGNVARASADGVAVEYRSGRARATAVYDRDTGWLIKMVGGDSRRPEFTVERTN